MQKKILAMLLASLSVMSYADCNRNITPTAPDSRYQLLNNATEAKDLKTNLIWQRCPVGQTWVGRCTGEPAKYTWKDALYISQSMGNGWRLPDIKELQSLVELACLPAMNQNIFSASDGYWSSSPVANGSGNAWIFNFNFGGDGYGSLKYGNYYVRLVRSSQ